MDPILLMLLLVLLLGGGAVYLIGEVLLVLVVLSMLGAVATFPVWPYSAGWGYYPSGGLWVVLLVLLVLMAARRPGVR